MSARYRRNPTIEAAPTQDETILFHPGENRFCLLNRSAAVLWERLGEPCTIEELTSAICKTYDGIDPTRADADVKNAITYLQELQLITAESTAG